LGSGGSGLKLVPSLMLERKTTSWGSSLYPGGDPTTARDRRGRESAYVTRESATKVAYVHFVDF
jgi:hypothetical protein